jgi:hypothetical protein
MSHEMKIHECELMFRPLARVDELHALEQYPGSRRLQNQYRNA